MYHTLGQRKGLGVGGTKDGSEGHGMWWMNVENNVLVSRGA